MATPYSDIYNQFLIAVQDYDLLDLPQNTAEDILERIMNRSVAGIAPMILRVDNIDLSERDERAKEFVADVNYEIIELIVVGMEMYWCENALNNSENFHNVLNTRDFSQYAPQNLIFRLREIRNDAMDRWRRNRRQYAHDHVDIATMGGLIK